MLRTYKAAAVTAIITLIQHTHVHTSIFQTLEQDARQALEDVLQMKADTNMGLIKERVG